MAVNVASLRALPSLRGRAVLAVCNRQLPFPLSSASLLPSGQMIQQARFSMLASAADSAAAGTVTAVEEQPKEAASPALTPEVALELAQSLDLRVGRILKAWRHPDADSLYVEEVDVGEAEGPRTICSGLVKYIPEEQMQDRLVVVLANLKPRNMRGVKSNGMLLAASDQSHATVQLLQPPADAVPGQRLWFGGGEEGPAQKEAATPNQLQKKKVWEAVQPLLSTTEDCVAALFGQPLRSPAGPVACQSLKQANVG